MKKSDITNSEHLKKLKEAEQLLKAEEDARKQQFLVELQALCQKYNCELTPMLNVVAHKVKY